MADTYKVEMIRIKKSFGGVEALKSVDFKVKRGEVHALVGENGAGKSTLMKILSGVYQKDSGTVRINGKEVEITDPHKSRELGIGIIYQELVLAPHLTVAENIFIGDMGDKWGLINYKNLYRKADELIKEIGFDFSSKTLVGELSVAYQQVVEIAKALSREADILVLDEPTAVLAPKEVEKLFDILVNLKKRGVSIIYISHRLEEVFKISDTITVLKDGCSINTYSTQNVTKDLIIRDMIGRKLEGLFPGRPRSEGEELLRVENLCMGRKVRNVSFSLKAGEVLGIAGLVGSGRTELARALFGADRKESGRIYLQGKEINISSPEDAVRYGIGFVPESRKEQGIILGLPISQNITLPKIKEVVYALGIINMKKEKDNSYRLMNDLNIKADSPETHVMALSGGNQQKVVLAKWFNADCKVMILDEPTRGVDVGAKYEIYTLINELSKKGIGVIMISSEMAEIIGMCDRTIVMRDGRIQGELGRDELSEEKIMTLAISSIKN